MLASLMGMLAGLGMLVLVFAILGAGAILLNLEFDLVRAEADIQEMSVLGIIIAAVVILASTLVGGFVAGRTARYGGLTTGIGSALWLALVLAIFGGLTLLLGSVSDTFNGFELADRLSRFTTPDLMTAAAITAAGLFLLGLLGGLFGGRLGETRDDEVEEVVDVREVEDDREEAEGKHEVEPTPEHQADDSSERVLSSQQSSSPRDSDD